MICIRIIFLSPLHFFVESLQRPFKIVSKVLIAKDDLGSIQIYLPSKNYDKWIHWTSYQNFQTL